MHPCIDLSALVQPPEAFRAFRANCVQDQEGYLRLKVIKDGIPQLIFFVDFFARAAVVYLGIQQHQHRTVATPWCVFLFVQEENTFVMRYYRFARSGNLLAI